MTRPTWTTPEQKEWLESRKSGFIEAKQKGMAALREYCVGVFKEFREQWPVQPTTNLEIAEAGSAELATKKKRERYDQRVREWFHNNTRSLSSDTAVRGGILKIKAKPKMLQDWQAYHALTYDTKWKPYVDQEWENYKKDWKAEHPTEKPAKKRFTIMVEFMKDKFKNETEEMKKKCEEYRIARKSESPLPTDSAMEANIAYQNAIDKLPHTLATIGSSIMEQTGWQITILAGGPAPDQDGMIMTYLSHTGKTKAGDNYEKFLGKNEYEEKLLSFERFLQASFSAEDCAARSLVKDEEDEADDKQLSPGNDVGGDKVEKRDEQSRVEDREETERPKQCEYLENKKKNQAELRRLLAEVKEQYPLADDPIAGRSEGVNGRKRPASTMKKGSDNRINKDSSELSTPDSVTTPADAIDLPQPADGNNAETSPAPASQPAPSALEKLPATETQSAIVENPAPGISAPASPTTPSVTSKLTSNVDSPLTGIGCDSTTNSASPSPSSFGVGGGGDVTAVDKPDVAMQDVTAVDETQDGMMQDTNPAALPSSPPRNDEDLPPWLAHMIAYLRGVSEDVAWQNLVTRFVEFEKHGPPAGNLSTKQRPQQVSDWIKSKKKDVVPTLQVSSYGKLFKDWWMAMQPAWRNLGGQLVRGIPQGESLQALRKGGTAGIYVVVVSLSWWLKAQNAERDVEAWALVDDLSWVIQELNKDAPSVVSVPRKRARATEGENSLRKTLIDSLCPVVYRLK
ncbi:hypothetical protein GALMADRAFT_1326101 [Galerina marginata CBS 339.88]|uniref:Uncharacterized protein n=1 Tax=Galerina marginata (strain CBS 339.88) TaxID=685588 RepID=A0A067T4X2_GALM3|nr:hypothetical protein GALMADRAFT_1326101 [Galerina marginata CBS 339.88]